MPLNLNEPHCTISNDPYGRVYEQDGVFYKQDGTAWSSPAEFVEPVMTMKVDGSGDVVGFVRPGGTVAAIGGASTFTSLEDAPATITAKRVLAGNADGNAIEFASLIAEANVGLQVVPTDEEQDYGVSFEVKGRSDEPAPRVSLFAVKDPGSSDRYSEMAVESINASNSTIGFKVRVDSNGNGENASTLELTKYGVGTLKMSGFASEETATSAATITVGGVTKNLAKVIPVVVDGITHYIPLFA